MLFFPLPLFAPPLLLQTCFLPSFLPPFPQRRRKHHCTNYLDRQTDHIVHKQYKFKKRISVKVTAFFFTPNILETFHRWIFQSYNLLLSEIVTIFLSDWPGRWKFLFQFICSLLCLLLLPILLLPLPLFHFWIFLLSLNQRDPEFILLNANFLKIDFIEA